MMHAPSKGFTSAIAAIPCGTDLRQMRMEVDNTRVNNPLLAQEIADFSRDCYGPSRARLFMRQPDLGSVAEDNKALQDLNWIGSRFLLNTRVLRHRLLEESPSVVAPTPPAMPACLRWAVVAATQPASSGGLTQGSACDRIKDQVDPDLMTSFLKWAKWLNQDEVTEAVIRQVISPSSQVKGNVYTDYGGQVGGTVWNGIARTAGTFGVALGSLAYFPAMDMVRQARRW